MPRVTVKWGKQQFENVELNTELPPLVFKTQLFSLSGVTPDRQKIMVKGGLLKDDTEWSKLDIKEGHVFMMMGTAGELPPPPPQQKVVFLEDMNEDELAKATKIPPGLENLGNTCYMNATLQCLKTVPELNGALARYPGTVARIMQEPAEGITAAIRDLFVTLGDSGQAVPPVAFLQLFRMAFPQFAQLQEGRPAQQDAEECWSQVVTCLGTKLKDETNQSVIQRFFGIDLSSTWKNTESADEPETSTQDRLTKIPCHITQTVNTLYQGLEESLKESLEKQSPLLNRTAVYSKTSKITRLPSNLTINFVRFFWRRDTQKKAKILRKVKFPLVLDMYQFCSDDLKKRLEPMRAKLNAHDEEVSAARAKLRGKDKATIAAELPKFVYERPADTAGENLSGIYELTAVLTHMGRSSDSGHYIAWVRKEGDDWWKFDDDTVSPVSSDEILKLDGGGDWHMAYLLLYRERTQ